MIEQAKNPCKYTEQSTIIKRADICKSKHPLKYLFILSKCAYKNDYVVATMQVSKTEITSKKNTRKFSKEINQNNP